MVDGIGLFGRSVKESESTPTSWLMDQRIGKFVRSVFQAMAMTVFVSGVASALGLVTFLSSVPVFGLFSRPQRTSVMIPLFFADVAGAMTTGVALAYNKKMVATAALCATLAGCCALSLPGWTSVLATCLLGVTSISICSALIVRAFGAEKLAIKTLSAHMFGLAGLVMSEMVAGQIKIGILYGAALSAAVSVAATIAASVARKYRCTLIATMLSTVAVVSSFVALRAVISGVYDRAHTIAFFGGWLPSCPDRELSEIFRLGSSPQIEECVVMTTAAAAGVVAAVSSGDLTAKARDFGAAFSGNAALMALATLVMGVCNSVFSPILSVASAVGMGAVATREARLTSALKKRAGECS